MPTKEEIILENELLKKKLTLAEAWMKREVAYHKKSLGVSEAKKSGRARLDNMLERESVSIITKKIQDYFGDALDSAPKFALNHLIDAEIYWQTLQKFPTLDALPVVSSYQKILESIFESILVGFRKKFQKQSKFSPSQIGMDKDIENVIRKNYTLSLGRWFQFFEKVRTGSLFGGLYEDLLLEYMTQSYEEFLELCISDPFYTHFEELMYLEVFGKKRHDAKITYTDAKTVRNIILGVDKNTSLLVQILRNTGNRGISEQV